MAGDSGVFRSQRVFVRGLRVEAGIGVHDHERGRTQALVVDIDVDLVTAPVEDLGSTFNYETAVSAAQEIVAEGHIDLVETFARQLATACLKSSAAQRVRVSVLKPEALQPDADAAGVEVVLERTGE